MVEMLLALLITRTIINNLFTFLIIRDLSIKRNYDRQLKPDRHLIFVLPVFQEIQLIETAIAYVARLINGFHNVDVYIVGNSREKNQYGQNPTLEIAKNMTRNRTDFHILELDTTSGVMAHQINYAVSQIVQSGAKTTETWVHILNIDSRLSEDGLNAIVTCINRGDRIIQQSAVFLSNFRSLGLIQKGVALYQSRWTISHEIKRLWLHGISSYLLALVVGHGLCINLAKLLEYGNLPEDTLTEDLHFGYYVAASAEKITSLSILELADSPSRVSEIARQKYVWSFGPMLYPKYLLNYIRKFPAKWKLNYPRATLIMIQGVMSYINWLISSWLIAYFAYQSLESPATLIFLTLYLLEYVQCAVFFYRNGYISLSDVLISPFIILASLLIHSLPADQAFVDMMLGHRIVKHKTAHV